MNLSAQAAAAHTQRMLADAVALFPSGTHSIHVAGTPTTRPPSPPGDSALATGAAAAGERYASALATVRPTDDGVNTTVAQAIKVGQQGRERATRVLKSFQTKAAAILPATNTPEGLRLLASTSQQHLESMSSVIDDTKTANATLATKLDNYAADYRAVAPRAPGMPAPDTRGDDTIVDAPNRRGATRPVDFITGPGGEPPLKPPPPLEPSPGDPDYPVPHALGDPADPSWQSYLNPDVAESWKTDAQGMVNPPGYPPAPPGPQRDQNWRNYLGGTNADGTPRPAGQPPAAYPLPEAVTDPGLKVVGAAENQQGTRYVWGGGSKDGTTSGAPFKGTNVTADQRHDYAYSGFDCSGLSEYAIYQATGYDPGKGTWTQFENWTHSGQGTVVLTAPRLDTSTLQPGDIIYYDGKSGTAGQHVAIYMGNGVTVEANESGTPVHSQQATPSMAGGPVRVVRPNS